MTNAEFFEMLENFGLLRSDLQPSAKDAVMKVAKELDDKEAEDEETPEEKEAREKKEKAEREKNAGKGESGKAEDTITKVEHQAALDSAVSAARAEALKEFQALSEAKTLAAPVIGTECALDSADAVYKFALEKAGVAFDGITETAALKALLRTHLATPAPKPVASSKKTVDLKGAFPNLKLGL